MNPRWLLRMSRLARHPPSTARVILGAIVIAVCLALWAVEHWIGWPAWLTLANPPRGRGV